MKRLFLKTVQSIKLQNAFKPFFTISAKLFSKRVINTKAETIIQENNIETIKTLGQGTLPLNNSVTKLYKVAKEIGERQRTLHIKLAEAFKHMKKGVQLTYQDSVYWFQLLKVKERSITETRDFSQISKELFKMLPFSLFITIPLMELLIPPYLVLFPNAMPLHFSNKSQINEAKENQVVKQKEAHYFLNKQVNKFLIKNNVDIRRIDQKEKILELINKVEEISGSNLIKNSDSQALQKMGDFLKINLITGTNIISKICSLIVNTPMFVANLLNKPFGSFQFELKSFNFKFNYGPLEYFKRKLLSYQINKQINKIRREDATINREEIDLLPLNHLKDISSERCLFLENHEKIKEELASSWLNISENSKISNSALLWYSVLNYEKNISEGNELHFR